MKGDACWNTGLSPRAIAAVAVPNPSQTPPQRHSSSLVKPCSDSAAPPDTLLTRNERLNLCTWLMGMESWPEEAISAKHRVSGALLAAKLPSLMLAAGSWHPSKSTRLWSHKVCAGQADLTLVSGLVTWVYHPDFTMCAPVLNAWVLSPLGHASVGHHLIHKNRQQGRVHRSLRGWVDPTLSHRLVYDTWTVPLVPCRPARQMQFARFAGLFLHVKLLSSRGSPLTPMTAVRPDLVTWAILATDLQCLVKGSCAALREGLQSPNELSFSSNAIKR